MLKHLYIQNYALIEELSIDLSDGFTVITGETGAGKSILLGALALLLGNRADPDVLMVKDKKCIVEGTFQLEELGLKHFFLKNDLDYDPISVLRREIVPSGRSRAFINDTPVNLDILKRLSEKLVDIHSQHQTLMLSQLQFQMEVLDGFINQLEWLQKYRSAYVQFEKNRKQLEYLIIKEKEAKLDEDYIQFQYNELEAAKLNIEISKELIEKEKFLNHAEEVIREVSICSQLLSEDELSALQRIDDVIKGLGRVSGFFKPVQDILERLQPLQIELKDITSELDYMQNSFDFNPQELEDVTNQLDNIYRLQQKYSVQSVEKLIELRDDFSEKLGNVNSLKEEIEALTEENALFFKQLEKRANLLHENRLKYALAFQDSITKILKQLGMKDASFSVTVNKTEQFTEDGCDQVQFLFNANKGGNVGEISKIASGGELSRLMLAIKSLVSKENFLPTVIFDEIDAGVSGEIAGKVGKILQGMSKNHQLIVISHLPQIASKADTHLLVSKVSNEQHTQTQINVLDTGARVDEIAKMMSDEKITHAAIQTAKELLGHPD